MLQRFLISSHITALTMLWVIPTSATPIHLAQQPAPTPTQARPQATPSPTPPESVPPPIPIPTAETKPAETKPAETKPAETPTPDTPTADTKSISPDRLTLRATDELRIKLDTIPTDGQLALIIGTNDVTSQIKLVETEIVYQNPIVPLPIGDTAAIVYLVKSPQDWQEIQRIPLKITGSTDVATTPETPPSTPPAATAPGSALLLKPTLNLNLKSQFSERRTPDAGTAQRSPSFTDATVQGGLSSEFTAGTFSHKTNINIFGSTFQNEALRFAQLAEEAPNLDLSDYLIDTTIGPVQLLVGHTCHGNHPFLLNNVCSRGAVLKANLTDRFSLGFSSLRSESIVGFDNIFGLDEGDNNTSAITIGYQIIKTGSSGSLLLETSLMDGSKLPEGNFNVGEIRDAERSKGLGFRLTGNDNGNRFKFDLGYALSTFTNPKELDPQLNEEGLEGVAVVAVKPETKDAYYLEASYDLFKDVPLGGDRTFSLGLTGRYERVNPLFRTLGATLTADRFQTALGANLAIAGATLQIQHSETEDNLAAIPTLLKTRNRLTGLNLNLPLQTLFKSTHVFLPTLTYSYQLNRQFGVNLPIPELSNFDDPSKIPKQVTTNHQIGANWTIDSLSFSYQHTNTFQDNRQIGREINDTLNISNQITTSWQASPRFQLSLGLNLTDATNFETNVIQSTIAPTFGLTWELFPNLTWTFNLNRTDNKDSLNNNFNRSDGIETLLTQKFKITTGTKELPGTVFIRYSSQSTRNQDRLFNLNTDATIQTINGGVSLSF